MNQCCYIRNDTKESHMRRTRSVGCFPEQSSDRTFHKTTEEKKDNSLFRGLNEVVWNSIYDKPLKSCLSSNNIDSDYWLEQSPKIPQRNVSFTTIEIREHPRTLGDVASAACFPALALDWYHNVEDHAGNAIECQTIEISIDEFENNRESRRRARPSIVSKKRRMKLLKDFGITDDDIQNAFQEFRELNHRRRRNEVSASNANEVNRSERSVRMQNEKVDELMRRAQSPDKKTRKQMKYQVDHGRSSFSDHVMISFGEICKHSERHDSPEGTVTTLNSSCRWSSHSTASELYMPAVPDHDGDGASDEEWEF